MAGMFPSGDLRSLPVATAEDIVGECLTLAGCEMIDIGCGEGALTIHMARQRATMVGIDPDAGRIAAARESAALSSRAVAFEEGVAEALPFPDGTLDAAVFSNSLHHVPLDSIRAALAEAARVLKPGGKLLVLEPVPAGSHFEVQRLWNDETDVRRRAYEEVQQAGTLGLRHEREAFYGGAGRYRDFADFEERLSARNAKHAAAFAQDGPAIRERFEAHARREDDAYVFDKAWRVNLLIKQG